MYKIVLKEVTGDKLNKELLAYSYDELCSVITLCPEVNYKIISVEALNCDLASEFIDEIIEKDKPKDLVFGIKKDFPESLLKDNNNEDSVNLGENYPHVDMY